MSNLSDALENLKDTIADKIKDASSLEVTTFTGSFNLKVSDVIKSNNNKFDIEKVLEQLNTQAMVDLDLVAYSLIKLDGDQANIVKKDLTAEDKELLEFHKSMIEASQNSRKAIVDFIKGLL